MGKSSKIIALFAKFNYCLTINYYVINMDESKVQETLKTPEVTPSQPVVATPYNAPVQPTAKKGGFGWGKCFLVGCALLLLCCICTIVIAVVAPNMFLKSVMGGNRAPDATLTRITAISEFQQLEAKQTAGMETYMTSDDTNGTVTVLMKEKDIIAFVLSMLNSESTTSMITEQNVNKLGVKLTPGKAVIELDLSLIAPLLEGSDTQNFDPKSLEGINISVTLSTSADNKMIVLDNFSTGNTFLDSIIPAELKASILESIQQGITESFTGGTNSPAVIDRIEFKQGELMVVLSENTTYLPD